MALNYIDEIAARIEATLDPEQRPDDDAWALYRLYALLVLVKGVDVSLEDVHDAGLYGWRRSILSTMPSCPSLRSILRSDRRMVLTRKR